MAEMTAEHTRIKSVMEDPSVGAIALVYANAFLNALPQEKVVETLQEFQSFLDDVLAKNREFAQLLTSAHVGRDDKLRLIDRVLTGRGSELFVNFLRVLAKHERLNLLPSILRQAQLQFELRSGKKRVQVSSAVALSAEALQQIQARLASAFPFQPIVETTIDPSLLGGLRIRVEDTVYDGSLRARLKQLRHRVRERSLHEIQSGRDRFSHPERD
jgi:F-type H+-transporting ATPase subunit delta